MWYLPERKFQITIDKHSFDTFIYKVVAGGELVTDTLINGATADMIVDDYRQLGSEVVVEDNR